MGLFPTGVNCAVATPIKDDLSPDYDEFALHCRNLLDQGCDGLAILGSTGEANSFSVAERIRLLETAVKAGIDPKCMMPGTGVCALSDTVELTKHALSVGVGAVVMLPPFYYKAITDDGLFGAYSEIIQRVGDDRLKIVLYHIPPIAQIPLSLDLVGRLREAYPDTVVSIKDSSGDLDNMLALIRNFPGLSVLAGADPFMLKLLPEGGAGCITATSNLCAADLAIVYKYYNDPAKKAEVDAAQARIVALRNLTNKRPQIASIKALLALRTGKPAWRNIRPPFLPLPSAEFSALDKEVQALAA